MDQKAKEVYNLYSESLNELRSSIVDSLVYNESSKLLRIGESLIDIGAKPHAILGFGKSSSIVVEALCSILPLNKRIFATCMCSCESSLLYESLYLDHPIPSKQNFTKTEEILTRLKCLPRNSTLLIVNNGGGSSMLSLPENGVSFEDKIIINKFLLTSRFNCRVINDVRKVLSAVKGGKLLRYINACAIINLILSDDVLTINNPELSGDFVSSGPTNPQTSDGRIAYEVLYESLVWEKLSSSCQKFLETHRNSRIRNANRPYQNIQTHVLVNNKSFLDLFSKRLQRITENVRVRYEPLFESVESALNTMYNEFLNHFGPSEKMIYIAAGEVTCSPLSNSKGGRCQHFVSLSIPLISNLNSVYCFALATDGNDYLKGVGGAFATFTSFNESNITKEQLDNYIASYNTYQLLSSMKCLFQSSPYSINLGDIYMICRI